MSFSDDVNGMLRRTAAGAPQSEPEAPKVPSHELRAAREAWAESVIQHFESGAHERGEPLPPEPVEMPRPPRGSANGGARTPVEPPVTFGQVVADAITSEYERVGGKYHR